MKDNNTNNNLQYDNPDDILALLQDFQQDEFNPNDVFAVDDYNNTSLGSDNIDLDSLEYDSSPNDSMDNDLLALLDMITKQEESEENNDILALDDQSSQTDDLSNDYNNDELLAFSDLWDNENDLTINDETRISDNNTSDNSDIGDIFADVLSVMKHEKGSEINESSKAKETKKAAKSVENDHNLETDILLNGINIDKAGKDKGLFGKIFSKKAKSNELDNESKNIEVAKKTKKAKKAKKEKPTDNAINSDNSDESINNIKTNKAKKKTKKEPIKKNSSKKETNKKDAEKKNAKKATSKKSASKKSKKKVPKEKVVAESAKVAEVIELDNSKPLNKKILVGVAIIIASIGVFVILGTQVYSESITVQNATWNFEHQRYDEAYSQISGQKITTKNKEIHEKITTVMYVNNFYNSYFSLYELGMYPESLDSLIQGLRNYNRNIDTAKELGIDDDLNSIRTKIMKELKVNFGLSEKKAIQLTKVEDKLEYSKKVHTIIAKLK